MRRTTAMAVATLAATALTLTACGRDEAGSTGNETAKDVSAGKATGTLTVWAMGAEGENLPKLVKEFEAANPGVKVNVTAIPWDSAHDKFTTAITAGTTPDAAMVGTTWMGEFAGLDALDPTPPSIDKSAYFEGAQKTTEVDGTSYGIPWYVETRLVFYRTDLAKKAGITTPPTDWDGLKNMAKAMQTKAGAKYGMGFQAGGQGSWQSIMPFAWSNDADLTKDDGKAYNFDNPQILEAVKYYQSYFTEGISDKAAPNTPTTEPDFKSGRVPMFISGPWMMSAVEKVGVKKDQYDVMPIPAKTKSASFVGGSDFVVFKKSKNRDSAWKLVKWLSDPKTQVKWYQQSTDLPSVKSAWQDPAIAGDTKLATFGKQLETAQAPPSFPSWEQVATGFDTEMEKVMKQNADAEAALKSIQQQAESIGTGQ
ncbi:carbohydrate ABC transporter substrate-binding protein, CUT1 family [Pedococcus dokdonensis]|uniref:Carbohydrate ABC transporter substrate-binding protein, CUT1 family n=1 Tax=Pedococcus dokdonensis TaxID=443156 RepID=A0A1H0TC25_9MICO|nr:sugar ABC transporter substrate-binding protein [Pedococcus dokdonensis]SDP51603.1 carbohydrate ABC transporter substrate-binding protein, CUT1 family [Pedococcus dokdonensis]